MEVSEVSDEALVARCRSVEGAARRELTDELFQRYYDKVGRWCYRITGDREASADLAQEVFMKAWRHLDGFTGSSKFSTWLYTIMRNECLNAIKARRTQPAQTDGELMLETIASSGIDPEAAVSNESLRRNLRGLLTSTLDETERNVFTLHYAEDLPLDAITRLLNLTNASGAKAFIVSAKRKLSRAVDRLNARGGALR